MTSRRNSSSTRPTGCQFRNHNSQSTSPAEGRSGKGLCLFFLASLAAVLPLRAEPRPDALPALIPSDQAHGRIGLHGRPGDPAWVVIDLGEAVTPDEVVIFPARIPAAEEGIAPGGFPPGLEVEIAAEDGFAPAVRLGRWTEETSGAGAALPFLRIPGNGASGRFLRVKVSGSRPGPGGRGRFFTLGEIVVLENGRNTALGRPVRCSASTENPPRWQVGNLTDGYLWCEGFAGSGEAPGNGYHSAIENSGPQGHKSVEVDLGEEREIDSVSLVPARPRDFADAAGFGFPLRFRVVADAGASSERILFDSGVEPFPNPGSAAVVLPVEGTRARRIRLDCTELWRRTDDYLLALAELEVWSGPVNLALGRPVTALDNLETSQWKAAYLTDGFSSRRALLGWSAWLDGVSERIALEARLQADAAERERQRSAARERWIAISGTGTVVVALLGVIALLMQRRQAEREREALRVRIAQDLHDEIGASLSHLALQGDLAARKLPPEDPVRGRVLALAATARETLGTMRDIVWLLAPAAGTWREFSARLTEIANRLGGDFEVTVTVEGEEPAGGPAVELAREVVLFLKEALTNARRHSGSIGADVIIRWRPDRFGLEVRDRGCGFDPEDPSLVRGAGLRSLQGRAARMAGRCEIRSDKGVGTSVNLEIPLAAAR